ncbi:MAG: TIGR03987 family protein [Desulfuromonadaceae bacterium]|nr:TIGR03987 family protein [Desulfuromonadaceae bacterium]MDD5107752.1 TIGR03987 family protein [Desulfuromonadaceae bacterium]
MLFQAVIWMNLALVFYSWAVFSARRNGLHRKHLLLFGFGLLCDYLGTHLMLLYGLSTGVVPEWHILVGIASLSGMAFHLLLAFVAAMVSRTEGVNRLFHRVSLIIYSGWLIAFLTGSVAGISGK